MPPMITNIANAFWAITGATYFVLRFWVVSRTVRQAWRGEAYRSLPSRVDPLESGVNFLLLAAGACQAIMLLQHREPAQLFVFGVVGFCVLLGLAAKRWA